MYHGTKHQTHTQRAHPHTSYVAHTCESCLSLNCIICFQCSDVCTIRLILPTSFINVHGWRIICPSIQNTSCSVERSVFYNGPILTDSNIWICERLILRFVVCLLIASHIITLVSTEIERDIDCCWADLYITAHNRYKRSTEITHTRARTLSLCPSNI